MYVVVPTGLTVMLLPVAPFDQLIVPPSQPVAVSDTGVPSQTTAAFAAITGAVQVFTVTVTGTDAELTHTPTLHTAV